jgi:BirA family transcriptional regulator, biotin operon repressor / biotin---[acetyl-CoA-carboxylase] ligase
MQALLSLIADGEFHSGKDLGDVLGVSRTAVWKHIQKLEPLGIHLESVKGKGYRLAGGLELLDRQRILSEVQGVAKTLLSELEVLSLTDSTNLHAMQQIEGQAGHGYVCLAEYQTAGRGRRGRTWVSPYGSNIYLSAVAEFEGGAAALEGLSLAVGVALVRALSSVGVEGVQLKWPNDLLWQGKKLAGILLEMSGDVAGPCQVVVGIGLNISMPEKVAEDIDQPWVDVASIVPSYSRNEIVGAMLTELLPLLDGFQQRGFAAYKNEWESMHAYQDCDVQIQTAKMHEVGRALGVTDVGALRVVVEGVERHFSGGEVSLRSLG